MADVLNVYKDGELVKSSESADGKAKVNIDGLDANTNYASGMYQVARESENGESEKVDVPAFKTKPIAVTGVTLDKSELTVEVGETFKLIPTIKPSTATNQNYKFMTSNRSVGSINDAGEGQGESAGSADIIVETEDGEHQATCKVNVVEKETPEEPDEDSENEA
ncbi:Ig-like domain-containing protein [Tetragenococcus halophilus]|uniref:Ig-like domain-containing protein n=1 Tax=Tetragenococcus halophilus TaxID=51669 RepID=UPI002A9C917C|nr:hypothetical protein TEHSL10_11480 [Tetragenococcus halophilus]